jgi:regulator of protease activity HflC (stomatin/prohibitin superfamily)
MTCRIHRTRRKRTAALPSDEAERGSVAAELAVALPVVVLTLALGVGALGAAARQVALQDAAADAARMLGRGESDDAAARIVSGAVPGAGLTSSRGDELVCATTSADAEIGGVIRLPLTARSCALDGGG